MAFLNRETGALTFSDGSVLSPETRKAEAQSVRPVVGGTLIVHTAFAGGRLVRVSLYAATVNGRVNPSLNKQRQFLFGRLALQDPGPGACVRAAFPFGEINLACDPMTGRSAVHILYGEPFASEPGK